MWNWLPVPPIQMSAFYASGASQPGDRSSTFGTTLAVKGLSVKHIED